MSAGGCGARGGGKIRQDKTRATIVAFTRSHHGGGGGGARRGATQRLQQKQSRVNT